MPKTQADFRVVLFDVPGKFEYNKIRYALIILKGGARMPSIRSKLLSGTMKSMKPILTGMDIPGQRKGMDLLRYIHPKNRTVELKSVEEGSPRPGKWAVPAEKFEGKMVLYTHGGAYVSGSSATHEPLICRLAEACRLPVLAYDYRLAPEHTYPAALEDAMAMFAWLQERGYAPSDIVVCGDSAGGGLTMALCMALRDRGLALPAAMVLLSPWTDLTENGDTHYSLQEKDPLISSEELREMALLYAGGEDLKNPYVSPFYGDFAGLPPVLIHVGSNEVLLDDSRKLATRMEAQGVEVDIDIYEGMWHVWHMFDVPEARAAIRKIAYYIDTTLEVNGLKKRVVHPGARYRHFKGKEYRVLYIARHSETLEEMVVYQQLYGEMGIWVRPLEMFLETVERDGRIQYRFEEIPEPEDAPRQQES